MLSEEPPLASHSDGVYESIEKRRAQAADTCKQLMKDVEQQRGVWLQAQQAHTAQQELVAGLKQAYACAAHLAVSFTDEQRRAQVHVRAAEVLGPFYPSTASFAVEASKLQAGFQRAVGQQADMAVQCQEEMAEVAERLVDAQQALPLMEQRVQQELARLEELRASCQAAKAQFKLLLHAKQWTRYRW